MSRRARWCDAPGPRPGDGVWVTGTIGDGALGLAVAQGRLADPTGYLLGRYRLPQPRVGLAIAGVAVGRHGCIRRAGAGPRPSLPRRRPGRRDRRRAACRSPTPRGGPARTGSTCLTGGDDYELLLAVPPAREAALHDAARDAGIPVTRIGGFRAGPPDVMVRGPTGTVFSRARRVEPLLAGKGVSRMNRNVWLLFCCQALMNAVMSGQTVMASLIGHALAVDKALNTLPMAIQMTAMMCASIPAGIVFARLGRQAGILARLPGLAAVRQH